jgi:hypothetical protein
VRVSTKKLLRPAWDSVGNGASGTRARVGLSPTRPQKEDGVRIDPPASEPCANGTAPDATEAAAPPLDPAVDRSTFQGLRVLPVARFSVVAAKANSDVVVRPRLIAPAARSRIASSVSTGDT